MQLLTAGTRAVSELAFAPDGQALVVACLISAPHLWTLPAVGAPVPLGQSNYRNHSFAFTPDSAAVSWLDGNGYRMEFDRRTGVAREVRLGPTNEAVIAQATCGADGRLVVRSRSNGEHLRAFAPTTGGWAEAWAISPLVTGGWRLAGCRADRFFLWEDAVGRRGNVLTVRSALTGEQIARAAAPISYALGFAAAPDGSALVLFNNSSLYCWRVGKSMVKVRTGTRKHYRAVAFHPDSRHLLAGNNDATARLIDTHSWQVVRQYTWDIGQTSAVAVSPDGLLAAAGGSKGRVVVWDLDL